MELIDRLPVLFLYINWRRNGWSERHYLPSMEWEAALDLGAAIAEWRMAAACKESFLVWGRIAFTDDMRLTQPITNIGLRSPGRAGVGNALPHTVYTRLLYRFETAEGLYVNRWLAGVPDAAVYDNAATGMLGGLRIGELAADPTDASADWFLTMRSFVTFIRHNTVYASQTGVVDPGSWRTARWSKVVFRKPTSRNTGRRFRRVTWLPAALKPAAAAGVAPPGDAAPAFDPCGAAVMVARSCYSRACRWYVDGPVGRIRFSWVDCDNKILPYRTVFWPYSQVGQLVNVAGTGELTAEKMPWYDGRRRSIARGLNPAGTAADFAGRARVTWDPPTPTPAALIPCCAHGETIMEAIEYVRVTVTDLGAAYIASLGTLTETVNGRLADLDGRTLVKGDRLLLRTDLADAGIYTVTDIGRDDPGGRPWVLQRLMTCDGQAEYNPGQLVKVWDGDTDAHELWELQTPPPFVVDTDPLSFALLSGGGGGALALPDINSWRQMGDDLARAYFAGVNTNTFIGETLPAIIQGGRLYALPFFCPQGGRLDKLLFEVMTAAEWAGARARVGVYRAQSSTSIYPGALVFGSGPLDTSTTGVKTVLQDIDLERGQLYWFALLHNESAAQVDIVITKVQAGNGASQRCIQSIAIDNADAGAYFLGFEGEYTSTLNYNAVAAAVEGHLEALLAIGNVSVTGTGSSGDPFVITFLDDFDDKPLLTWTSDSLSGGTEVARLAAQNAIDFYPIFGVPAAALHESAALGLYVAQAFGALPDPFPTLDPVFILGANQEQIPKLGAHFAALLP